MDPSDDDAKPIQEDGSSAANLAPYNSFVESGDRLSVVLLGAGRHPGTTSLIRRYTQGYFEEPTKLSTLLTRVTTEESGQTIHLAIWDIDYGSDGSATRVDNFYLKGAHGVLVTFDLSQAESVDQIAGILEYIASQNASARRNVVLVGTKLDLAEDSSRQLNRERIANFAEQANLPYFETSALTGDNVKQAFDKLIQLCIQSKSDVVEAKTDGITGDNGATDLVLPNETVVPEKAEIDAQEDNESSHSAAVESGKVESEGETLETAAGEASSNLAVENETAEETNEPAAPERVEIDDQEIEPTVDDSALIEEATTDAGTPAVSATNINAAADNETTDLTEPVAPEAVEVKVDNQAAHDSQRPAALSIETADDEEQTETKRNTCCCFKK